MSDSANNGETLTGLIKRLYPICRSITGNGVRESLAVIGEQIPLEIFEIPSGTRAFDWTVPEEWNIRRARVENLAGEPVVDFANHNLHVLNYSIPIDEVVSHRELDQHLFSIPEHPEWIPYRTAYYSRNWGFCLTQQQRDALQDEKYRVLVDSEHSQGSLTYAECFIPGKTDREVVLYTHVCHPSLCNDNLTGIAVATEIAKILAKDKRRYSYRIVFGPGTIGSITWLSQNQDRLDKIAHGLVIGLLGDKAPFTYKKSRSGAAEIDDVAAYVLATRSPDNQLLDFSPYGYDERQFGSPGINLPFGRLTRSVNGGYDAYHSSGDNLSIIAEDRLRESVQIVSEILDTLDTNRHYINLSPNCEPQLGKRGLYRPTGGEAIADREAAMLWMLNQADGMNSVLDIARKSGIRHTSLVAIARELVVAGLIDAHQAE